MHGDAVLGILTLEAVHRALRASRAEAVSAAADVDPDAEPDPVGSS